MCSRRKILSAQPAFRAARVLLGTRRACVASPGAARRTTWTASRLGWLPARTSRRSYAWSNEVFVVGGNVRWTLARRRGVRATSHRLVRTARSLPGRYAGSPLARSTLRKRRCRRNSERTRARARVRRIEHGQRRRRLARGRARPTCIASSVRTRISRVPTSTRCVWKSYDAVVVGGGGLIYASRDGTNEAQNLANYLKFGPIATTLRRSGRADRRRRSGSRAPARHRTH